MAERRPPAMALNSSTISSDGCPAGLRAMVKCP
jgi:hypothetical protein